MPLYTPFMEKLGAQMGGAIQQQERNKLAQGAYMGDQQAMSQLQGYDPQLAQQIQSGQQRKQQLELQQAAQQQTLATQQQATQRKHTLKNQEILTDIFEKAGQFPTAEEGKAFADAEVAKYGGELGEVLPFTDEAYEQAKQAGSKAAGMASAKTKIFADGTSLAVLPSGESEMRNKAGDVVEGDERLKVLEESLESEARLAGAKKAATQAITKSGEMFDQLEPIKKNIANIDDGIAAIDAGAESGVVMSMLPSIRDSSIKLDNVQKRMGLDVIGMTTFGALSKGELDIALSTAMPTTLQPKELREWLVKKKDAQAKLSQYLESAAQFLGTPGNTIADFIELRKLQEKTKQTPTQTPELSEDDLQMIKKYGG